MTSRNTHMEQVTKIDVDGMIHLLKEGFQQIRNRGGEINEADTRSLLITPVLDALGYSADHRRSEHSESGNRPDEICYSLPVTQNSGYASIILEAKPYNTDFDKPQQSGNRSSSPDRQIQRYLKQHSASGPNTLGILTDGQRWRLYNRAGTLTYKKGEVPVSPDINFVHEYDFGVFDETGQTKLKISDMPRKQQLLDFINTTTQGLLDTEMRTPLKMRRHTDRLFESLKNHSPDAIISQILSPNTPYNSAMIRDNIIKVIPALSGVYKDIYENDWENHAYIYGPVIESSNPPTLFEDSLGNPDNRMVVAAVKYEDSPGGIGRQDTAICARIFANTTNVNAALVFTYGVISDDITEARLAICVGGKVNMTAAFDPEYPLPSAKTAIENMLQLIQKQSTNLTSEKLLNPLAVTPLRQQFYKEVATWIGKLQQGKTLSQRQTILRHLIRMMFVWILKEENIIPPELFENAFIAKSMKVRRRYYHREVLSFLFHDRLNTPNDRRTTHPNPALNDAMIRVPFLNGSLFAKHDGDDQLFIAPELYWNTDEKNLGLFTILSRYHWTLDEHKPGESEQTLDPELLSNLFERLITPTETGEDPPDRQPDGTYYTPTDVTAEMVKDALAAAVCSYVPSHITNADLLELFGDPNTPPPLMTPEEHYRLIKRINELRIFDPAVGSGAFMFSALIALKTALDKLDGDKSSRTTDIIKRQLFGQDKNSLAIQITRLRLFIAIKANEKDLVQNVPLPNLEARIICADTLETIAHSGWRPESAGGLEVSIPGLMSTLTALAQNRSQWFDAHTEDDKTKLRESDQALRSDFQALLKNAGAFASRELKGFADFPLFHPHPKPALTDSRLLFYESPWRGFDIVIGNPPYEKLPKEQYAYLSDNKLYRTTNVGNIYTLFCETALALAKPDGVITMIVPFSISFGQKQQSLRDIFDRYCQSINLRHYDNRPDTTFNASPTVKSHENRQRVTIVTGVLGNGIDTVIKSTGLQRWPAAERHQCLNQRLTIELPRLGKNVDLRISGQWPRIPTKEAAGMLRAIIKQKLTIEDYKSDTGETLCFPKTAYQFIASIPKDSVSPRSENSFTVKDMDVLRLVMAALNGHIALGWWWMYGDGFHLKPHDLTSLTIPDAWEQNPQPAIDIGQRLIEAIPECITEAKQQGGIWRNVNFYKKRDLIEKLDHLHIESLGLPVEPLLTHLRIMRSSSSYNYWG